MKIIRIGVLRRARYRLDAEVATPTARAHATCGDCTWSRREPDDGILRCALFAPDDGPGPPVAPDHGCEHHQRVESCDGCGACCREAFDSVPVEPRDEAILRHVDLVRYHADGWCDLARSPGVGGGTRCSALFGDGSAGAPFRCRVYVDRPSACSELEIGSDACLFARRRVGLTADPRTDPGADQSTRDSETG